MIFLIYFNLCVIIITGFNISPKPNFVFKPKIVSKNQRRSSYFGYSLKLNNNCLIIGAPRLNYTKQQSDLHEAGMIYKCSLIQNDFKTKGICEHYIFDEYVNINNETVTHKLYNNDKNYQWLGSSIDSGPDAMDPIIVCAPRLTGIYGDEQTMHGICYISESADEEKPINVQKISLINNILKQVTFEEYCPKSIKIQRECKSYEKKKDPRPNYLVGQQGFSVHWVKENKEYILGSPGLSDWRGSVIRYKSTYDYDIPNPRLFNDPTTDAYFGYSVSSGYFTINNEKELFYIGSAPRKEQVFIFTIVKSSRTEDKTIRKFYTFDGQQFGDYYGYSILADDFNNDGWTDVVISAPFHKNDEYFDVGKVFVYVNNKNPHELEFTEIVLLPDNLESASHFGTTLTKLGDINQDGYNDLAISAPFYKNGTVYIYLGDKQGIQIKPSQVLEAPMVENSFLKHIQKSWFGIGMSGNVDVDGNGFNDLAIGSPMSEIAYIYKTYPVVKIKVNFEKEIYYLNANDTSFQLQIFYSIKSQPNILERFDITFNFEIESNYKRIQFENNDYVLERNETAFSVDRKYENITLHTNFLDNFKPFKLKAVYELKEKINADSTDFCDTCGITDPTDDNSIYTNFEIITGCKNHTCNADLIITNFIRSNIYVVGSSKNLTIKYLIKNDGENAYAPKLKINYSQSNKINLKNHKDCQFRGKIELICNLATINNNYMTPNQTKEIEIIFDTSKDYSIEELIIEAEVTSAGDEKNSTNNKIQNIIQFKYFSNIKISSYVSPTISKIAPSDNGISKIFNTLQIKNYGPSSAKHSKIYIIIPICYWNGKEYIQITSNIGNSSNDELLNIIDCNSKNLESLNQLKYDESEMLNSIQNNTKLSNHTVFENQTIIVNCSNESNRHRCDRIVIDIWEFDAQTELEVTFFFEINHKEINRILNKNKNVMSIEIDVEFQRTNDAIGSTIELSKLLPKNFIFQFHPPTNVWIFVVSVLVGVLILVILTYALYKLGFFKRAKKDQLKHLIRESQRYSRLSRPTTGLMEFGNSEFETE